MEIIESLKTHKICTESFIDNFVIFSTYTVNDIVIQMHNELSFNEDKFC